MILLTGAAAVILLLAFGENRWALGAGVLAAALFVLMLWDPARVLKKHSRADWRLDGEAPRRAETMKNGPRRAESGPAGNSGGPFSSIRKGDFYVSEMG